MHEAFYGKYNGIYRACANSVYQASPRGGGPGDEATATHDVQEIQFLEFMGGSNLYVHSNYLICMCFFIGINTSPIAPEQD